MLDVKTESLDLPLTADEFVKMVPTNSSILIKEIVTKTELEHDRANACSPKVIRTTQIMRVEVISEKLIPRNPSKK